MILDLDGEKTGYILEVDLKYPQELHDSHNEFPLAPENIQVTTEMLSPYALAYHKKFDTKQDKKGICVGILKA